MKLKCKIELTEENGYFQAPPILFELERNASRQCGYDVTMEQGATWWVIQQIEKNLYPGTEYRKFIDREWEWMVRSERESHEHWDAASRVDMVGLAHTVCGIK
jgi:hypothetical protein